MLALKSPKLNIDASKLVALTAAAMALGVSYNAAKHLIVRYKRIPSTRTATGLVLVDLRDVLALKDLRRREAASPRHRQRGSTIERRLELATAAL